MRDITISVFQFDELTDTAKERARDWYRGLGAWSWQPEWWESAQAFTKIAPINIVALDYDRRHVSVVWTDDANVSELSGVRAWKWLKNNGWFEWAKANADGSCTMTGFCGDAPFGDPLVAYAKTPSKVPTLKQVFYECAQAWVNEAANDYEHSYSDEAVDETILANEYEFTSDGERFV